MNIGALSGSWVFWVLLIVAILALVGAILAIANKRGTLALILGIVLVVLCILPNIIVTPETIAFWFLIVANSGWEAWIGPAIGFSFFLTIYITFEALMIFIGGLIATIAGE
jgi:hypothetical protein